MILNDILAYITEPIGCFLFAFLPVILKKFDVPLQYKITLGILAIFIPSFIVVHYYSNEYGLNFNITELLYNKKKIFYGLLYSIYYYTSYIGFNILPVSMSIPIYMCGPIIMTILDRIINKTPLNIAQIISFIISLIGILLVVVSEVKISKKLLAIGSLLVFISTFIYAYLFTILKNIIPKKIKKYKIDMVNYELLLGSFLTLIISTLISITLLIFNTFNKNLLYKSLQHSSLNLRDMLYVFISIFIISYIGNSLFYYSYSSLPISTYGVLENFEVIASLIIGYFFLKEKITSIKIIGCFTIISGILMELYFKNKKNILQI
jgi:drug/metabolite transporter (DMT)-like permease